MFNVEDEQLRDRQIHRVWIFYSLESLNKGRYIWKDVSIFIASRNLESAHYAQLSDIELIIISARADRGPRSRVCARETLRSAPNERERKISGARVC